MSTAQDFNPFEGTGGNLSGFGQAFLEKLPEADRETMRPYIKAWDSNVSQEFQRLHSEIEPFKEFKEAGVGPDDIRGGLTLLAALNEDPEKTLQAIASSYGITMAEAAQAITETASTEQGSGSGTDFLNAPEFKELKDTVNMLAQLTLQQNETIQQKEQDQILDQALADAKQNIGDFDMEVVLPMVQANGGDVAKAVKKFRELVPDYGKQASAPVVMGGGGALPVSDIDVRKLDEKGTKALIAQILDQANKS